MDDTNDKYVMVPRSVSKGFVMLFLLVMGMVSAEGDVEPHGHTDAEGDVEPHGHTHVEGDVEHPEWLPDEEDDNYVPDEEDDNYGLYFNL